MFTIPVLLTLWTIAGAVVAAVFYLDGVLKAAKPYKVVVCLIVCGPVAWLVGSIAIGSSLLKDWLKK